MARSALVLVPVFCVAAMGSGCQCRPVVPDGGTDFGVPPPPTDPPGDGIVRVYVIVRGTMPELGSVHFVLERIDVVHEDASGTGDVRTVLSGPLSVALPGIGYDVAVAVLEFPVAAGELHQIRLVGGEGTLVLSSGEFPLRVPSGAQTGLKVIPEAGTRFTVPDSGLLRVLVTFDPHEDLLSNAGTGWRLRPVVRGRPFVEPTLSDYRSPTQTLLWAKPQAFPDVGVNITRGVFLDVLTNEITTLALDEAGSPVDLAALRAADIEAARVARGSLSRRLADEVAASSPGALLDVIARLDTPPLPRTRDLDRSAIDFEQTFAEGLAQRAAIIAAAAAPLLEAVAVAGPDAEVVAVSDVAPMIQLRATASFVATILREMPSLRMVETVGTGSLLGHDTGIDFETPAFLDAGDTGGTSPLAIIEPGHGVHPDMMTSTALPANTTQEITNVACTTDCDCDPDQPCCFPPTDSCWNCNCDPTFPMCTDLSPRPTVSYCRSGLCATVHTERMASLASSTFSLGASGAPLLVANGGSVGCGVLFCGSCETPAGNDVLTPATWAVAGGASVLNFSVAISSGLSGLDDLAHAFGALSLQGSGNTDGLCPDTNPVCPSERTWCHGNLDIGLAWFAASP